MARPNPDPVNHRETAKHRAAFEVWYEADRDFDKVRKSLSVSHQTIYNWAAWFGWESKANIRDAEVERRNAKAAIQRKATMVEDHRKAGELTRKRGVEYLAKNTIRDEKTALSAVKLGIEIERTAEGLPAWMVALMGMDDAQLADYIAAARGTAQTGDGDPAGEGAGIGDSAAAPDDQPG